LELERISDARVPLRLVGINATDQTQTGVKGFAFLKKEKVTKKKTCSRPCLKLERISDARVKRCLTGMLLFLKKEKSNQKENVTRPCLGIRMN